MRAFYNYTSLLIFWFKVCGKLNNSDMKLSKYILSFSLTVLNRQKMGGNKI